MIELPLLALLAPRGPDRLSRCPKKSLLAHSFSTLYLVPSIRLGLGGGSQILWVCCSLCMGTEYLHKKAM